MHSYRNWLYIPCEKILQKNQLLDVSSLLHKHFSIFYMKVKGKEYGKIFVVFMRTVFQKYFIRHNKQNC